MTSYASPFSFSIGDAEPKKTAEILKEKRIYPKVKVITDSKLLSGCKDLGLVKSRKTIEMWQMKNSCEILTKDLQKETTIKNGNTLYLDVTQIDCSRGSMEGKAFTCESTEAKREK